MTEAFSPREVQARVRAGASAAVVAAEMQWPVDKVERYAGPPLAERAFIAEQAQLVTLHRHGRTLADLADQACEAIAVGVPTWDAYRGDDGRWYVTATTDGHQAVWTFDPAGRNVHAHNTTARVFMGLDEAEPIEHRPRLVAVPEQIEQDDIHIEDSPEHTSPRNDTVTLPIEVSETPAPPKKRARGKRASVPSWDEILFGAQRDHEES